MAKDDKNTLIVAQEVKLVKILAGNNKKLRDRTIKRLQKWLSDRTSASPLTEEGLMRIWKGLFYAMWMSDKPLIQEDCAEKIANVIHIGDVKASLLFFKCFLKTMVNEWYGIDNYRVDKFLMLIRRVFRQIFAVLHENNWEDEYVNEFREILNSTALKIDKTTALGLVLHIDDIFLEELAKVSLGNIEEKKVLELIQPFAQQLARMDDSRQIQHITDHIFKHLINQTEIACEFREKFSAWKRQGFPGGNIDAMEVLPDLEEETAEDDVQEELNPLDSLQSLPKDPRAGKVDVILPQIKFDPVAVVDLLEELKFKKYTTSKARKTIKKLIKQFMLLSEGVYPLGLTKISPEDDIQKSAIKFGVKRLQNFEKSIQSVSKKAKAKALRHKKAQELLLEQIDKTQQINNKKQGNNDKTIDSKQKKSETTEKQNETNVKQNNLKQNIKQNNKKQKKNETNAQENNKNQTSKPQKTNNKKQKNAISANLEEFIEKSENHINKTITKAQKRKIEPGTIEKLEIETKKQPKRAKLISIPQNGTPEKYIPLKSQNHFRRNSGIWTVDEFEVPESPVAKINPDWEKPLKNGETEIFVVSSKSKKRLKRLAEANNRPLNEIIEEFTQKMTGGTPTRKNIVKNPFGNHTPKSEKKIKFSNEIQAQEFREHQNQILSSPVLLFDGSKKPSKSLLKPSPYSSPINPFYIKNNQ